MLRPLLRPLPLRGCMVRRVVGRQGWCMLRDSGGGVVLEGWELGCTAAGHNGGCLQTYRKWLGMCHATTVMCMGMSMGVRMGDCGSCR